MTETEEQKRQRLVEEIIEMVKRPSPFRASLSDEEYRKWAAEAEPIERLRLKFIA